MEFESELCVSIVTVVFNARDTIEKTIESVLEQGYKNIDYIIVDGGSFDGTLDVIERYRSFLGGFVSETDNGIYNAMNKGIALAKGDIVGILNADDYLYPHAINDIVSAFDDDIDFVYGTIDIVEAAGKLAMTYAPLKYEHMLTKGLTEMGAQHSSIYVKREIYNKLNSFNEKYRIVADHDFFIRLFESGCVGNEVPGALGAVSMNGVSDSWKTNMEMYSLAVAHGISPAYAFIMSMRRLVGRKVVQALVSYSPDLLSKIRRIIKSRYTVVR